MIIKTQPYILKKRLNITYFDDAEFKKIVNIYSNTQFNVRTQTQRYK